MKNKLDRAVRGMSPISLHVKLDSFEGVVLRFMMSIKNIKMADVVDIDVRAPSQEMKRLSSMGGLPIFSHYGEQYEGLDVILMFLDESPSYRMPILMSGNFQFKAVLRTTIYRVYYKWVSALENIENNVKIRDSTELLYSEFNDISGMFNSAVFNGEDCFMGSALNLADVYLVAFFYRLSLTSFAWQDVPEGIKNYCEKMIGERCFLDGLTAKEVNAIRYNFSE